MPIIKWKTENYMRVELVEFEPGPGVTEFTGQNGVGKSSLMNSAAALLSGGKEIAWNPIREGAESARISMDITGVGPAVLRATRTFKKNKAGEVVNSLTLENEDGAKYPKPVDTLKALINANSFDPLLFIRSPAKDQVSILQKFVTGVDFTATDKANADDFAKRTEINRDAKAKRAQLAGIVFPPDAPAENIDEAGLVTELANAGDHNAKAERWKANRAAAEEKIEALKIFAEQKTSRAAELRAQADALDGEVAAHNVEASEIRVKLDAPENQTPAAIDTTELHANIQAARQLNAKFEAAERAKAEADALEFAAAALEGQSAALTKAIEDRNDAKAAAVQAAQMPIEGLSLGDGMVIFQGQPLDQASSAEQIRVSIAIAAALNPKLKIAFVRDGSLLDNKSWKLLQQFAVEHELQVFVETVDSSRADAIVIEDGHVRGAVAQAAE